MCTDLIEDRQGLATHQFKHQSMLEEVQGRSAVAEAVIFQAYQLY